MQIGILEGKNFSRLALKKLQQIGEPSIYKKSNLISFLNRKEVLFVRLGFKIDKKFLEMAPRLGWICSPTTGLNHLDIAELRRRRISLISLQGEKKFLKKIRATPEHTMGLIVALLRRYSLAFSCVNSGSWDRNRCLGEELQGNRVGILGLGRVGFRVAAFCQALGSEIFWYDPAKVACRKGWKRVHDPRSLIAASRIVVLCANHVLGEKPIIGGPEIKLLKNRYFVNTARGELVDENALFRAVCKNHFLGVALDVLRDDWSPRAVRRWLPLLGRRNLILTPHIGGATTKSMEKTEIFIVDKLIRYFKKAKQ